MKIRILITAIIFVFAFSVNAQKVESDTMYIMKSNIIVGKYHASNQTDSLIFYKQERSEYRNLSIKDFYYT